jgi:hypothetical protein
MRITERKNKIKELEIQQVEDEDEATKAAATLRSTVSSQITLVASQ